MTDQYDAMNVILIQLCLRDRIIGARSASVGIGKKIDSVKLKILKYKTELVEPHLSIVALRSLFTIFNAFQHGYENNLFYNFLYKTIFSIFKFN